MLTKQQKILLRSEVLSNLDIEKIDELQSERSSLVNELVQIVNRVANKSGAYLTSADTLVMAEIVADEIEGYGPLRDLMADDTINDILVNGPNDIWVERAGILEKTDKEFVSNEQLTDIAKRLVARVGRRIDDGSPLVDSRLPDGSRLNVVIAPIALDGTSISIRKFSKNKKTLQELVNFGSMTREMANFLIIAARSRVNIIVSGGTGSGKTTLLNALSNYISHTERVITLEDTAELRLEQPHVVRLETRLAGVEHTGEVTMQDLVINALRMRPERIIVGECRGGEAFQMLQAMNTGHDGSMSTLHANSPRDATSRLESMVMMSNASLPLEAIRRNISSAVNIIVQASRLNDGSRKIMNITEVMGMENGQIVLQDIFSYKASKYRDKEGKILGEFINHGLLTRSAVFQNAQVFNLSAELQSIFGETE
ncbi:CpaF family protein [Aggregatibacter actinomycetemcomitans]|uniref:CpaF family protein n=3 Tax=Aggregatibacter actinomycetemcomitans TaxID=714 RepID=E1CIZ1_AGGAC|nr:CpaF family protein [Aggregatibacter actinomycetemcomitans]ACX82155.1 pilus assembly protein CpaF [Aggregatibacter actinomycetemcomitans D11S-1]ANU81377.1 pilus assembly protein CpaF [Aggregatibacter actinomycetemcomitans]EGY33832.1 tight adherence protein A [Aggregatibacter actinomycetemcomitans serotype e str. SC1083]EKX96470.1 type II/IV secretion system protein [Aggregatibacter actinomycetemcomitans Y4]KND83105.1 pilus assembly protein CpaF [Aggregatibacter actinomycetemcomitans serotyp